MPPSRQNNSENFSDNFGHSDCVILGVIGRQGASVLVRVMGLIETRSLPTLTRSYPRRFTFYVAEPVSSILSSLAVEIVLTALRVGDWTTGVTK